MVKSSGHDDKNGETGMGREGEGEEDEEDGDGDGDGENEDIGMGGNREEAFICSDPYNKGCLLDGSRGWDCMMMLFL